MSEVRKAKAVLNKYAKMATFVPPNKPFGVKSLAGKTIAIVAVDQTTPALVYAAQGVKAAAAAAGLKTTLFDAKDNPSEETTGVEEAVAAHAGAILLDGITVSLVTSQLKQAAAAKIPTVSIDNGVGAGPKASHLYADATPDFTLAGTIAADGAIVATGGKLRAILIGTPGITPGAELLHAFERTLKACSTCKILNVTNVQLQDWFTTLQATTSSLARKYPTANAMLPIYNTMAISMIPGLQAAGAAGRIRIFSSGGSPDDAKLLLSSPAMAGIAAQSDVQIGWLAVNQAMRGMLRLPASKATAALRYITPAVVKKVGQTEAALYGTKYIAAYKHLWKLGK